MTKIQGHYELIQVQRIKKGDVIRLDSDPDHGVEVGWDPYKVYKKKKSYICLPRVDGRLIHFPVGQMVEIFLED